MNKKKEGGERERERAFNSIKILNVDRTSALAKFTTLQANYTMQFVTT